MEAQASMVCDGMDRTHGVMVIETRPQSGEVLSSLFVWSSHIPVKGTATVHGSLSGELRITGRLTRVEIACVDGRVCLVLCARVKIFFPSLL